MPVIDFPGVGVIDLEAPRLPEKVLDVATEPMFAEPSIMETIASVSKALHEYERAGGFAPPAALEAAEGVPEGPAAVRSPPQMRPRHRRPVRGGKRPSPSWLKLPKPPPPAHHGSDRRDRCCCRCGGIVAVPPNRR
jgi:hypothetical protein